MPHTSADGTDVYYEAHGEGPALVFVHGSGGHHAIWWNQIAHFRDRYKVIAIDLPGFGNSDKREEAWDAQKYPDAILAVLDDAGVDKAVLVAQSLGCASCLALAVQHPERVSAALLSHSLNGIDNEELQQQVRADRAEAEKVSVIDRLLSKQFQEEHPEGVLLFKQMGTFNAAPREKIRGTRDFKTTIEDVNETIAKGVFICFMQGTNDAVVSDASYAIARKLMPEAHVEVMEGAPHSVYFENPELFNGAIENVLARVPQLV